MSINLTDTDKTLGIIVCSLTLIVMGIALALHMAFDYEWALQVALMAISWWFGATMVWLWEKHYRYFRYKDS